MELTAEWRIAACAPRRGGDRTAHAGSAGQPPPSGSSCCPEPDEWWQSLAAAQPYRAVTTDLVSR